MSGFFRKIRWREAMASLVSDVAGGIARFPVPALLCVVAFVVAYFDLGDGEEQFRIIGAAVCGVFLFMSLQLVRERHGWSAALLYLIGLPLLAGIGWLFQRSSQPGLFFPYLAGGLFLFGTVAPYLRAQLFRTAFWTYCFRVGLLGGFAGLGSLILLLGGIAIIQSLQFLFGLDLEPLNLEEALLDVVVYLVLPIAVLSGFPKAFDEELPAYPRALTIIVCYALIPLLAIYTLILYAYMAKIALAGELPEGQVAYLVLAYALVGVGTYLVSYPLAGDVAIARFYQRGFFPLLLAPLVLLGIAIGVRIDAYGVTEDRYAIVLCLCWLAISAGLGIFLKPVRASVLMVLVLAILAVGASFGPWGAVEVSARSQIGRLEVLLKRNDNLGDDKVRKTSAQLSREDRIAASEIVDYLSQTGKLERLEPLMEGREAKVLPATSTEAERIAERLGFAYVPRGQRGDAPVPFRYTVAAPPEDKRVTRVAGYDYVLDLTLRPSVPSEELSRNTFKIALNSDPEILEVRYQSADRSLAVRAPDGRQVLSFDLSQLLKRVDHDSLKAEFSASEAVVDARSKAVMGRLIIDTVYGYFGENDGQPVISNIAGKLLLRPRADTGE